MIRINKGFNVPLTDVLFVFALESEAAGCFDHCQKLITGIGKVQAAFQLSKYLQHHKPKLIVNAGSAGSNYFDKGQVICCDKFVQRDMDVRGLGFALYQTPLSSIPLILETGIVLEGLTSGICGTGDSFETGYIDSIYNVVDMEAYALAYVAQEEKIPFICLKYISDGADDNAAEDWNEQVHKAAAAYSHLLFGIKEEK